MKTSICELRSFLHKECIKHEFYGDTNLAINGFCAISEPKPKSIAWIKKIKNYDLSSLDDSLGLLIVTDKIPGCNHTCHSFIITENPKVAYFEILGEFFVKRPKTEIAKSSIVETIAIGDNVSIGHNCYICDSVAIGNNVIIKHNVVIDCPAVIGDDCIIESGAVIGSFGFGYYKKNNATKKVPDFAGVKIGNRVEIGANTCIARGTLTDTVIEDDVKIDNLCHIAHNARIGARCFVVANTVVSGSCRIGNDTYIAPGAVLTNQISVGDNSFVGMGAVVNASVGANQLVVGNPARVIKNGLPYVERPI